MEEKIFWKVEGFPACPVDEEVCEMANGLIALYRETHTDLETQFYSAMLFYFYCRNGYLSEV